MITRKQIEKNYRRLVVQRNVARPGTPERQRAELNLHMFRWTLASNNFTPDEIAAIEADVAAKEAALLTRLRNAPRLASMVTPREREWMRKGLFKSKATNA